jgi:hypothetical protein
MICNFLIFKGLLKAGSSWDYLHVSKNTFRSCPCLKYARHGSCPQSQAWQNKIINVKLAKNFCGLKMQQNCYWKI